MSEQAIKPEWWDWDSDGTGKFLNHPLRGPASNHTLNDIEAELAALRSEATRLDAELTASARGMSLYEALLDERGTLFKESDALRSEVQRLKTAMTNIRDEAAMRSRPSDHAGYLMEMLEDALNPQAQAGGR